VWADAAGPSLTAAPPRLVPLRWIWYRRPPDRLRLGGGADLRRARPNVRQVVYVGDGTNDVCPVLQYVRVGPDDVGGAPCARVAPRCARLVRGACAA